MTVRLKTLEVGAGFFDEFGRRYVVHAEADASGIVQARRDDQFGRIVHFTAEALVIPEKSA